MCHLLELTHSLVTGSPLLLIKSKVTFLLPQKALIILNLKLKQEKRTGMGYRILGELEFN